MGFINGFLIGYFWRSILSLIFVFGAIGAIGQFAEGRPPLEMLMISAAGMFVALPIIVSLFHSYMMSRKGVASSSFVILRGLYVLAGVLALSGAALFYFKPELTASAAIQPSEEDAVKALFGNLPLAEAFVDLAPYWTLVIVSLPYLVTALIMTLFSNRLKRKRAQAVFDYQAAVVAEGVRQGMN